METTHRKLPTHELVYRRIRGMILFGELAPGAAVTIQGLVQTLGAGITPVREAIRRLTAEGALESRGNRRACVPELTPELLEELAFARETVEPRLAYMAAKRAKPADVDALEQIDDALNTAIDRGDVRAYLEQNYRFHMALYRLSRARILMSVAGTMWLRVGPSLRVVCGQFGTYSLPDKHEEAIAALRAGDADAVATAIKADLRQGHDQIGLSINGANLIKTD